MLRSILSFLGAVRRPAQPAAGGRAGSVSRFSSFGMLRGNSLISMHCMVLLLRRSAKRFAVKDGSAPSSWTIAAALRRRVSRHGFSSPITAEGAAIGAPWGAFCPPKDARVRPPRILSPRGYLSMGKSGVKGVFRAGGGDGARRARLGACVRPVSSSAGNRCSAARPCSGR
jgi:hypothetical protein